MEEYFKSRNRFVGLMVIEEMLYSLGKVIGY